MATINLLSQTDSCDIFKHIHEIIYTSTGKQLRTNFRITFR